MNTVSESTRARRTDVRQHARHQVIGLSAQFLLGMAISLIGPPRLHRCPARLRQSPGPGQQRRWAAS